MIDVPSLLKYQSKAAEIINDILAERDFTEKELMLQAAAMTILTFDPKDDIYDELSDCEKYLYKYHETGDIDYLNFAKDEYRHAQKPLLALKSRVNYAEPNEVKHYNVMLNWAKDIEHELTME